MKIEEALNHLNSILPLKQSQEECSNEIRQLHREVLRSFVTCGRILTREEMAKHVNNIEEAVHVLNEKDMVTFSENGEPTGAYPFTMQEREHKIIVNEYQVHAMCALDALAVSPMFEMETKISSKCRITGDAIVIQQNNKTIENIDKVADVKVGIAWGSANTDISCAESLCTEMIFLRDSDLAQQWLEEDPTNREIFSLMEAVEFAAEFFVPLVRD